MSKLIKWNPAFFDDQLWDEQLIHGILHQRNIDWHIEDLEELEHDVVIEVHFWQHHDTLANGRVKMHHEKPK